MDPVGGNQPIYNEDASAVLVANGEVYNHANLREVLSHKHEFATTSDSETVLHLFEELGTEAATALDGMFALAIADTHADGDNHLFQARDPIGIKPLYYGWATSNGSAQEQPSDMLYFASELKAIARHVDNVREFPPGTYFHPTTGFRTYYTVPEKSPENLPVETHIRNLRRALEQAVSKRLMSDVPLGAFLSGGLDSSIIAALVRQQVDELHTFSVGIEGSPDLLAARHVARHIDSVHHEYSYTAEEVLEKLPEIVYHLESYDQDLVRSAIPCYFCSRLAAEHVKVILTGEGADELFAGYTYYKDISEPDRLHRELRRSVSTLHNINLQRVDRLTMAHSLEGRVPFLDTELIEVAQSIPPELKLRRDPSGQLVEKWILRKAVEDLLPEDIVWRGKAQFDEGSGTVDLLNEVLRTVTQDIDPVDYAALHPTDRLRAAEECFYHKLLVDTHDNSPVVLQNVGRWVEDRL
jgi:asparagine synthase (glutamine-hydrolysing)